MKMEEEKLVLEKSWDKVFPKSDKVNHKKVTFHNRYGITLAADLYEPKTIPEKYRLLQSVGHLVRSRNNRQGYMLKC